MVGHAVPLLVYILYTDGMVPLFLITLEYFKSYEIHFLLTKLYYQKNL